MHLLEITPAPCNICGRGNTQDDRDPIRFIDFERDINWNDPLILCEDCVAKAGGLVGMLSKDTMKDMRLRIDNQDKLMHELKAEMDRRTRRAKKLGIEFVPIES